jgi:GDP-L-fucose synthase
MLISSSTVYQENSRPISEEQLNLNKPPYSLYFGIGWMNRYIEQLAKFYYKICGLPVGIVRPSYIYGPYDNFDDIKSHVVPALIKRAIRKEDPYLVWGKSTITRDFIYIDDFIDDLIGVFERYCLGEPLNIGSGFGISIREAVRIILDVCGHKIIPCYDKNKPTGIPYRVLNITKLNLILGKKNRTTFKKGIENTVKWYQSISKSRDS